MFGKLTLQAFAYDNLIVMGGIGLMLVVALTLLGLITYFRKWIYLWNEWLTSLDHKKIGIMYIILALVMLLRGFADAVMMRTQQALAVGTNQGVSHTAPLRPGIQRSWNHYDYLYGNALPDRTYQYCRSVAIGQA